MHFLLIVLHIYLYYTWFRYSAIDAREAVLPHDCLIYLVAPNRNNCTIPVVYIDYFAQKIEYVNPCAWKRAQWLD